MLSVLDREEMFVVNVDVPERLRQMDSERVDKLAESMAEIGLQTPITVRSVNDGESVILVAGRHRLEAAARLGWDKISVVFVEGDEDDFRLWEIAENLHRSELTVLERSEHIAEWIRLTEKKLQPEPIKGVDKLAQLAPVSVPVPKGGKGKKAGIRAASRTLGVDRDKANRSIKIDSITPEAKQACRDAGLDKNQTALLKVAAAPAEQQPEIVRRVVEEKSAPPPPMATDQLDEVMELLRLRLGPDFARFQRLMRDVDLTRFKKAIQVTEAAKAA